MASGWLLGAIGDESRSTLRLIRGSSGSESSRKGVPEKEKDGRSEESDQVNDNY